TPSAPPGSDPRYRVSNWLNAAALPRLLLIGVAVAVLALAFAAAAGWLSPGRVSPEDVIDRFQAINGMHDGFRRNPRKGVCFAGWFDSKGAATRLSRAEVFKSGRSTVYGRFALAAAVPAAADKPAGARSMAVNITAPNGDVWRSGMNN